MANEEAVQNLRISFAFEALFAKLDRPHQDLDEQKTALELAVQLWLDRLRPLAIAWGTARLEATKAAGGDEPDWSAAEILEELIQSIVGSFTQGAQDAGILAGFDMDATPERALEFAEARAADLVGMRRVGGRWVPNPNPKFLISDTVRDLVRGAVERAVRGGWSAQRLATELESYFGEARADMIARTETAMAYGNGSEKLYRQAGLKHVEILDGPGCTPDGHDDNALPPEKGPEWAGVVQKDRQAHGQVWTLNQYAERILSHPHCRRVAVPWQPPFDQEAWDSELARLERERLGRDPKYAIADSEPALKYRPDQRREPQGSPDGGRWAPETHGDSMSPLDRRLVDFKPDRSLRDPAKVRPVTQVISNARFVPYSQMPFLAEMHRQMDVDDPMAIPVGEYMERRDALFTSLPVSMVSAHRLVVTQQNVNTDRVKEILEKPETGGKTPPYLVRYANETYVINGHHRIVAEVLNGADTIMGRVLDLQTLRNSWSDRRDFLAKYNPDQPRDPAGSPTGGQWTSGNSVAEETPDYTPKKGDTFLVFRAGAPDRSALALRNAGNAYGVAAFLQELDDWEKPSYGQDVTQVYAHEVTLHDEWDKYQQRPDEASAPGRHMMGENAGRRASVYSFGPEGRGYSSKEIGSIDIADLRARLKEHGYQSFDGAGSMLVGDVIREMFGHAKKYAPDQPRVPAGSADGGQWTSGGSGAPIDSFAQHTDGKGNFTPERKQLHAEIIERMIANAQPSGAPEFVMLGGGSAAGKSRMLEENPRAGYAHIDSDSVKSSLPEYKKMTAEGDTRAASYAHEESSYIAKQAMQIAFERRLNTVLDGTGDGSLANLDAKVSAARKAGYKVIGEYVTVSTEEALRRNLSRAAKTGRMVPPEFVRRVHSDVSRVVPEAMRRGLFDHFKLWDTEHGAPILVAETNGDQVLIHRNDLWEKFLEKGK